MVGLPRYGYEHTSSVWRCLWERVMCSIQAPHLRGSDEAIIPHRLGDEGLGCLYGTNNTSLIARHLLRDKLNSLEAMWDNTSWWAYHVANMDTPHQLPNMNKYLLYYVVIYVLVFLVECCGYEHISSIGAIYKNKSCALSKPLVWGLWWGHYPILVRRQGLWLLIWH